nr:PREDICTED: proteoglycan 3-like [Equus przewalskii]
MESDPAALAEQLQCPREEETVQLCGHPGCNNVNYLLVRSPMDFRQALNVCRRCYRGNLVSIHSSSLNYRIQISITGINEGQVWIGGFLKDWRCRRRFRWTDGSRWNFSYWASGQPRKGRGRCVALCTRDGQLTSLCSLLPDGHWRGAPCETRMPFICSF